MKEGKNDKNSIELWGQTFQIVESGLDENEVNAFIKKLVNEREDLILRQEHLSSLAKLAERTIAEADIVATQIREEAEAKAQEEVKEIIAEAEKRAEQIIKEKTEEAVTVAQEEVEAIKADAAKNSVALLKEKIEELQSSVVGMIGEAFSEMLTKAESVKQEVTTVEDSSDGQSSEVSELDGELDVSEEGDTRGSVDPQEVDENIDEAYVVESPDIDEVTEEQAVSRTDWWSSEDEEWVVLEFLPPRDQDGIDEVKKFIDGLPEVNTAEVVTMVDKTWIKVLVSKKLDLTEKLLELSQVKQLDEIEEVDYKKIKIELMLNSEIDMSRNKLNRDFSNILSNKNQ